MEAAGIEPEKTASLRALSVPERVGFAGDPHAPTANAHATPAHSGQVSIDPLERALLLAAEAGRFDVVAKLADELHARRCEKDGVVSLDGERARREPTRR